jgi:transcriptional regulator with XRE-family HTH domain
LVILKKSSEAVAGAVKSLRGRLGEGLTQRGLADKIGVEKESVHRYESGASRPDPKSVFALIHIVQEHGFKDLEGIFFDEIAERLGVDTRAMLDAFSISEAGGSAESEEAAAPLLEGLDDEQREMVLGLVAMMRDPKAVGQLKKLDLWDYVQDYIPARKATRPKETNKTKRFGAK